MGPAQDTPAVDLGLDALPDSASGEKSVNIEVLDEPDGPYLAPDTLRGILGQVDSRARVEWDSPAGVLRIFAGGRQIQAMLSDALVDVDGTTRRVGAPLRLKSSGVIIPMTSVRVILGALNLDLDIEEAPAGGPLSESGNITMRMSGEEAGATNRWSRPPATASMTSLPAIVLPQGFAGETGLTWSQLADARHGAPPRKITVAFDAPLERFAAEVRVALSQATGIEAELLPLTGPRNDPKVVARVVGQYPDLLVDLMLSPTASVEGTGAGRGSWGIEVWTVHDALWPGDRTGTGETSARLPYRTHQYHNLALASLVRTELGGAFPGRGVLLELAPSYLLRRVNAPCIAILLPPELIEDRGGAASTAARATAQGLANYVRGMQAVAGFQ